MVGDIVEFETALLLDEMVSALGVKVEERIVGRTVVACLLLRV